MFIGHKRRPPARTNMGLVFASIGFRIHEEESMDTDEALTIMRALAGGTDPAGGQALPQDSPCRRPNVVKALNRALGALVQAQQREQQRPPNAGRYWSREEDAQVCAELRRGIELREIAKSHHRTVPSIVARLVKLGEVKPAIPRAAEGQGSLIS
jgi:hypothetical protein